MKTFLILILFSSSAFTQELSQFSYHGVSIGDSTETTLQRLPSHYVSYEKDYPGNNCFFIGPKDHHSGVQFMMINNQVASIYIQKLDKFASPVIAGLGIGSTKTEILKLFPTLSSKEHPYGGDGEEYLSIEFSNGKGLLFETSTTGIVVAFRFSRKSELFLSEGCS